MFIGSKFYSPCDGVYPPWKPVAATVYLQSVPMWVWVCFFSDNACTILTISEQSWLRDTTLLECTAKVPAKLADTSYGI